MATVRLFDEPQGHRDDVPRVRNHRGLDRRRAVDRHSHGTDVSRAADLPEPARVQRLYDRPRLDHDLLHGHAGDDWRLWQLDRPADDWRARHGVPAHEQYLVLAAAGVVRASD